MKTQTFLKQVKELTETYKRFYDAKMNDSELKRLRKKIHLKGFRYRIRSGADKI